MSVFEYIRKSSFRHAVRSLSVFVIVSALSGCVTTVTDRPENTFNPLPTSGLSAFRQIELLPIRHDPDVQMTEANYKALQKIQENVDLNMGQTLKSWNTNPPPASSGHLLIEPVITEIKFVSGGTRFFAGAFAGSSAVVMQVKIYDKERGDTIAHPEFYQRAAAMGGAWSLGTTDNLMLVRIANLFTNYLKDNYDRPVGGRTGIVEPES